MSWILGWGVFSNTHNIKQIKKSIQTLQNQNEIQEKILQLTDFLNLTMFQVSENGKVLLGTQYLAPNY